MKSENKVKMELDNDHQISRISAVLFFNTNIKTETALNELRINSIDIPRSLLEKCIEIHFMNHPKEYLTKVLKNSCNDAITQMPKIWFNNYIQQVIESHYAPWYWEGIELQRIIELFKLNNFDDKNIIADILLRAKPSNLDVEYLESFTRNDSSKSSASSTNSPNDIYPLESSAEYQSQAIQYDDKIL